MSPKRQTPGKKAVQTRKRKAAATKAAATHKHRAAGMKAAAARKTADARARKKPSQPVHVPPTLREIQTPPAAQETEEPAPTPPPEKSVPKAETSEPSNPNASLRASMEALRNARWGKR